nr:Gag-Pol polyprotein [Tanacetum cinerariifolium]
MALDTNYRIYVLPKLTIKWTRTRERKGLVHLARNYTVRPKRRDVAYLHTRLLIAQKEEVRIQLQAKKFDLMATVEDIDEIKEVNANYILMANLQQALTSDTQTDKVPVYDSDGSAEVNARVQNFDNHFMKKAAKFVRDFKSLAKEAEKSLDMIMVLENENERLIRAVVSQDIMSIVQRPTVVEISYLQTEHERTKESDSECKSDTFVRNNANAYNPQEPTIKRILNSTSLVCRLGLLQAYDHESETAHHFVWNFMGTVRFGNDHVDVILGYGDLQRGNILITWGLLQHLCPSYEQRKSKNTPHPPKPVPNSKQRLHLLHMDLCGPMRVKSINGKWLKRLLLRVTLKTVSSFTDDLTKHHMSLLTARNYISPSYMYSGLFVIPRMIVEILGSLDKENHREMNVTFDELLAMAFEQHSSKPELQGMTYGQISSGLDLTYASSTITYQKLTEHELDLLFEVMYDDYIDGQQLAALIPALPTLAAQVLQTPTTSTTISESTLTPTNSSSQAADIPNTSQDVDELQ